jgi:RNA polymerase sigma factor (sigma-70 family)
LPMYATQERPDRAVLAGFIEAMRPRLWAMISRYRIEHADAEDLLQDTFVAMISSWDRIENHEAWLLGTLRFLCCDYWRRKMRDRMEPVDPLTLESLLETVGEGRDRADLLLDVAALMRQLSPRSQRLLCLRYRLGLSPRETAASLGYSAESLRKATSRALARIRRLGRLPDVPKRKVRRSASP